MFTPSQFWRKAWSILLLAALGVTLAAGQQSVTDESKRKLKSKVAPAYPELARRMSVSGRVRIELTVAPDGHVKSTRALGGHPILVQSCVEAVKDWKYMPGPDETTLIVEFDFKGGE